MVEDGAEQEGLIGAGTNETTMWFREIEGRVVTSSLDLVFTSGNKPFVLGPHHGDFIGSDHCVLEGGSSANPPSPRSELLQIDWNWWEDYDNKDKTSQGSGVLQGASAYTTLAHLTSQHLRPTRISPRSKRWWDSEVDTQLERTRGAPLQEGHYKRKKTILKRMMRKKKREHWEKFLKEHRRKDPW